MGGTQSKVEAVEGSLAQEGQDLTRVLTGALWQLSGEQTVGSEGGSRDQAEDCIGPCKRDSGTGVG